MKIVADSFNSKSHVYTVCNWLSYDLNEEISDQYVNKCLIQLEHEFDCWCHS